MTLLDPQSDRTLYTEVLTTPPGFRFDCAVALTYSLGLDTLLAVPLHLLIHAGGQAQTELLKDRLAVLDGLRQTTGNLSIFHQQGRILAPHGKRILYSLLEESVFRASAPRGGIFHPKVWLLRFSPEGGDTDAEPAEIAPLIRLAVLSRNLTADPSWDVSLAVDGRPQTDEVEANEQLVRLLRALPDWTPELPGERAVQIASLADDLARTPWELPDGIDEFRLHAIGLEEGVWLPRRSERLVVMSPFCTADALKRLAGTSRSPEALISRPEEFVRVSQRSKDAIKPFERRLVLRETAEADDEEDTSLRRGAHVGLHAKLYLCDEGDRTRLFVGSANSTNPALIGTTNVEVMVELAGSPKRLGSVDEFLDKGGLGAVLEDFDPADIDPPRPEDVEAEKLLERACDTIAAAELRLSCHEADDDHGESRGWRLELRANDPIELPPGLGITAWPITLPRGRKLDCRPLLGGREVVFGPLAVSSITRFIAFEIAFKKARASAPPQTFVLCVPAEGLPVQARDEAVVRQVVRNRDGFVRYLLFLLGGFEGLAEAGGGASSLEAGGGGGGFGTLPLLEQMTRAFCRDPSRLDSVRRLVDHLRKSGAAEHDEEIVPADFLQLWSTFESAMPGGERGKPAP